MSFNQWVRNREDRFSLFMVKSGGYFTRVSRARHVDLWLLKIAPLSRWALSRMLLIAKSFIHNCSTQLTELLHRSLFPRLLSYMYFILKGLTPLTSRENLEHKILVLYYFMSHTSKSTRDQNNSTEDWRSKTLLLVSNFIQKFEDPPSDNKGLERFLECIYSYSSLTTQFYSPVP
jgi:hypothetical protein